LVDTCVDQLAPLPELSSLGFVYVTDTLAPDLAGIVARLRAQTRIANWVGSVGLGICAAETEVFEPPGLAVMVAALPPDDFRVFGPVANGSQRFDAATEQWIARRQPQRGVVHGNRGAEVGNSVALLSAASSIFFMGGLSSGRQPPLQVAGGVSDHGLSGVLFAPEVPIAAGVSQGCTPICGEHVVTEVRGNVIVSIDGRPALDVFRGEVGELLSRDLRRAGRLIVVGFPMAGLDLGQYVVRNAVAFDTEQKTVSVAHAIAPSDDISRGDRIVFCRRDAPSAVADLERMVRQLKQRVGGAPRAGLYFSCIMRGPNLFGPAEELAIVARELGDIPLVGFFCNGEIWNDRVHEYTAVLVAFR
jgi:small ligand-binding sensory domain FIST